jgi:hypothetical protein
VKAYFANPLFPGSRRGKTPEGYLVCIGAPLARSGVQIYKARELGLANMEGDELVEVYRAPEEVFSQETISSFEGKSVTCPHPPVFLTPENDASYSKGHISNVRKSEEPLENGEYALVGDLIIKDAALIQQIENGSISELSAGYTCDYDTLEE